MTLLIKATINVVSLCRAVTFHPDLVKVPQVYGAVANTIHVWTLESGSSSLTASMEGHHSAITALQLTHDTKHMVR